ncbi:MAG TPA: type 1 glutamine amidotransferase domain-containing protein [Polyangia bacterium]|jgi:putative intracellular protease/amidase|nr:type 1 glutamine amidotransferase domain-containing protein [Polyangia bacterium]
MSRILMPLPDTDFDVTETSVPWRLLTRDGHDVVFATEHGGQAPAGDALLLDGSLGKLGPAAEPRAFYDEMARSPEFRAPIAWSAIEPEQYDGLILAGGHAPGMKQYLGSTALQEKVGAFWRTGRPVGAICHGVIVLARTIDPATGKSVLHETRTTCLPKYMERGAWLLTRWTRGRYYRTYDVYVEDEVKAALGDAKTQFLRGPLTFSKRGSDGQDDGTFVVEDGRYVSARWPGDAYLFARRFAARL